MDDIEHFIKWISWQSEKEGIMLLMKWNMRIWRHLVLHSVPKFDPQVFE